MPIPAAAAMRAATSRRRMSALRWTCRGPIADEPLADEDLYGPHPIAPPDLLSLCARPRIEPHGQFVNTMTVTKEPGGDLRFDVEPVGRECKRACDLRAHHLVTGLHVRERPAKEHVGHARQEAVGGKGHEW